MNATLAKRTVGFQVLASLSSVGYYRVASVQMDTAARALFSDAYSWILNINTNYWYNTNMSVTLLFNMAHNKYKVTELGRIINVKVITKVRVSRNSDNKIFIDVYYYANNYNTVFISIDSINGRYKDIFTPDSLQDVTDTDLTTLIEYEIV